MNAFARPSKSVCALWLALGVVALALPAQAQIKRWVDERGIVHYSGAPPQAPPAGPVTDVVPVPPLSAAEAAAAAQRLQQYRDQLEAPQRPTGAASAPAVPPAPTASAPTGGSCAEQWARYEAAYACMDPYRMVDGRIRPEAFEKCPVVPQPDCPRPGSQ